MRARTFLTRLIASLPSGTEQTLAILVHNGVNEGSTIDKLQQDFVKGWIHEAAERIIRLYTLTSEWPSMHSRAGQIAEHINTCTARHKSRQD